MTPEMRWVCEEDWVQEPRDITDCWEEEEWEWTWKIWEYVWKLITIVICVTNTILVWILREICRWKYVVVGTIAVAAIAVIAVAFVAV